MHGARISTKCVLLSAQLGNLAHLFACLNPPLFPRHFLSLMGKVYAGSTFYNLSSIAFSTSEAFRITPSHLPWQKCQWESFEYAVNIFSFEIKSINSLFLVSCECVLVCLMILWACNTHNENSSQVNTEGGKITIILILFCSSEAVCLQYTYRLVCWCYWKTRGIKELLRNGAWGLLDYNQWKDLLLYRELCSFKHTGMEAAAKSLTS